MESDPAVGRRSRSTASSGARRARTLFPRLGSAGVLTTPPSANAHRSATCSGPRSPDRHSCPFDGSQAHLSVWAARRHPRVQRLFATCSAGSRDARGWKVRPNRLVEDRESVSHQLGCLGVHLAGHPAEPHALELGDESDSGGVQLPEVVSSPQDTIGLESRVPTRARTIALEVGRGASPQSVRKPMPARGGLDSTPSRHRHSATLSSRRRMVSSRPQVPHRQAFATTSRTSTLSRVTVSGRIASGP